MSEKSDEEKKRKKTSHCNRRDHFTRKAPTKKSNKVSDNLIDQNYNSEMKKRRNRKEAPSRI